MAEIRDSRENIGAGAGARPDALSWALLRELARTRSIEAFDLGRACREARSSEADLKARHGGLEAALLAAQQLVGEELLDRARVAAEAASAWPEQVRAGLGAVLEALAEDPQLARVTTQSLPAISPAAQRAYSETLERFAELLRGGRAQGEAEVELPSAVEFLAVGAAESLIFAEIDADRAERLQAMAPEILFSVLTPFIGPERAGSEMRRAIAA
jgi:hypothetical protein